MSEQFTAAQVAEHKDVDKGLYIIIDSNVYKMDTFVDEHPGGSKILKRVGGKDASKQFWKVCTFLFAPAIGHHGRVGEHSIQRTLL
jgi:cytochrome b involved in lipid metabolism